MSGASLRALHVILAGGATETVPARSRLAEILARALTTEAGNAGGDDKIITGTELGRYVQARMEGISRLDATKRGYTVPVAILGKLPEGMEGEMRFKVIRSRFDDHLVIMPPEVRIEYLAELSQKYRQQVQFMQNQIREIERARAGLDREIEQIRGQYLKPGNRILTSSDGVR